MDGLLSNTARDLIALLGLGIAAVQVMQAVAARRRPLAAAPLPSTSRPSASKAPEPRGHAKRARSVGYVSFLVQGLVALFLGAFVCWVAMRSSEHQYEWLAAAAVLSIGQWGALVNAGARWFLRTPNRSTATRMLDTWATLSVLSAISIYLAYPCLHHAWLCMMLFLQALGYIWITGTLFVAAAVRWAWRRLEELA